MKFKCPRAIEQSDYKILYVLYKLIAGDSFSRLNLGGAIGYQFSTFDRDNDGNTQGSCATTNGGGWWYNYCSDSALTATAQSGQYEWYHDVGELSGSFMMIRP